jgi:hypothetical protein
LAKGNRAGEPLDGTDAELIGIHRAIEIIDEEVVDETREGTHQERSSAILGDS